MATQPSVSFGWFQPSPVPDVATAQTIRLMCECIERSANDPLIQSAARNAVKRFANDPMRTGGSADLARAVWWYCRYSVERLRHQAFKALVAAFPEKKQLIVDPVALLQMNPPAGDCSAFSMLVCALLNCLGIRSELVTVAASPAEPDVYTHVYPRAVLEGGARMPLDAHAGDAPGWEVPAGDVFRKQIWDASGTPVGDSAQAPSRLHEYVMRGMGGEGDTVTTLPDLTGTTDYTPTVTTDMTALDLGYQTAAQSAAAAGIDLSQYPTGSSVAPAQNSANWAAFATALAKSGMTLAEINAIQPGTVVSANGAILRQSTGLAVPVGAGITAAFWDRAVQALLLLGGGALLALFLVMQMAKKS